MMTIISLALIWLGVGFASEEMGLFAHSLNTVFAIAFIGVGLALPAAGDRQSHSLRIRILCYVSLLLISLAAIATFGSIRLFALAIVLAVCSAVAATSQRAVLCRNFAAAIFCFAVYSFALERSLIAWHSARSFSAVMSSSIGNVMGLQLELMPSASGLGLMILASSFLLSRYLGLKRRSKTPFLVSLVTLIITYFVFLKVTAGWSDASLDDDSTYAWIGRLLYPGRYPTLLALLLLVPVIWYARQSQANSQRPVRVLSSRKFLVAGLASILVATLSLTFWESIPSSQGSVLIYEKGFVNWIKPHPNRTGPGTMGMMGMLPEFLATKGWNVTKNAAPLSDKTLEGHDVLFLVNPTEKMSEEARTSIDRFVVNGGALILLGDHTSFHSNEFFLNDLLENKKLQFRFDNAEFAVGGWLHSYERREHPLTAGLRDQLNEGGIVIGASLDVGYPAVPLVTGRYGHSDPGNYHNETMAYMDNRVYDAGERLGDCVLVAAQDHGKGKIILFGDTSPFGNGIMTMTWPFVSRIFDSAASENPIGLSRWRDALGLVALCVLTLVALTSFLVEGTLLHFVAISLLSAACAGLGHWVNESHALPAPLVSSSQTEVVDERQIAMIDESFGSIISPAELDDTGLAGLGINLMRQGFYVIGGSRMPEKQLDEAAVTFLVGPLAKLGTEDVERYTRYVEDGGKLIIAVGWNEYPSVKALLSRFDIRVSNRPLGRTEGTVVASNLEPVFYQPWAASGPETIAKIWDEAVVLRSRRGAGELILVADGHFFMSRNMECKKGTISNNIAFVHHLLSKTEGN